jgi:hypothetical protein
MQARAARELMLATLPELGFGGAKSLGERLLVRDGRYAGIRFEFEAVSAVWLIDAGEVRFITSAGKLLKTVHVDNTTIPAVAGRAA